MERVILGDNQFFGVNHMSEEKARAQSIRFRDDRSIIQVLDTAYKLGIRVFMCTTHERVAAICQHVRDNPERYAGFQFFPCMPYAHKYADAAAEYGLIGALKRALPADGAFYLYADVSDFTSDSFEFAKQMLEQAHVAATPGIDFDPVHGRSFIRFSYARSADEMREAVNRISHWLK